MDDELAMPLSDLQLRLLRLRAPLARSPLPACLQRAHGFGADSCTIRYHMLPLHFHFSNVAYVYILIYIEVHWRIWHTLLDWMFCAFWRRYCLHQVPDEEAEMGVWQKIIWEFQAALLQEMEMQPAVRQWCSYIVKSLASMATVFSFTFTSFTFLEFCLIWNILKAWRGASRDGETLSPRQQLKHRAGGRSLCETSLANANPFQ